MLSETFEAVKHNHGDVTSVNAAQPLTGGQRRLCSCCHGVDVLLVGVGL